MEREETAILHNANLVEEKEKSGELDHCRESREVSMCYCSRESERLRLSFASYACPQNWFITALQVPSNSICVKIRMQIEAFKVISP